MKKLLLLLLLIPQVSSAAITKAQIAAAKQATLQMRTTLNELLEFINMIQPLIQNDDRFGLSFSTNTVDLSPQLEQDIFNYYQSLKTTLATEYGQLP